MIAELLRGVAPLYVGLAILALGILMMLRQYVRHPNFTRNRANDETVVELVSKLSGELAEANRKIRTLEAALEQMRRELQAAEVKIAELTVRQAALPNAEHRPAKPLLLVMCNELFGEDDALAIRRTGIPFHRLANATSTDLDRYLQACRQDGSTPWWVVISAHMGPKGIAFTDGVMSAKWLSQRIRGVRVLMLAGCENEEVAAQLVGLAKHVIVVYETIDTVNAQDLNFAFWSRVWNGMDPQDAFAGALEECPQVSEFVQMRTARG